MLVIQLLQPMERLIETYKFKNNEINIIHLKGEICCNNLISFIFRTNNIRN